MRIAHVGNPKSEHVARWVEEFSSRGHECKLFAPPGGGATLVGHTSIGREGLKGPISLLVRVRDLRSELAAFAPDVLHAHSAFNYGSWAALSGFHPLVVSCWGSDLYLAPEQGRLAARKVRHALRKADVITGDSRDLLRRAEQLGAAPSKLLEIVVGVDTQRFRPCGEKRAAARAPVVLSTRRHTRLYRLDVILRAAARLAERDSPARFIFVGEGPETPALGRLASGLALDDRVTFTGRLTDEDLARAYCDADVYVTVPETDATSVSLLEAMAVELPVVASDLPANRQWLEPDGGLLVPVGDADALADAIDDLLGDEGRRAAMGIRNRAKVLEEGDWKSEMDQMEEIYLRLAEASP